MNPSRAIVLVGGASRRMGTDKALVTVDDRPAAVHMCRLLEEAGFDDITLVGGEGSRFEAHGRAHLPDIEPGRGPLEGIRSALAASAHEWTLVVPVDLMFLDVVSIVRMVAALGEHRFDDVVYASCADGPQPLFGWWRRSTLQTIERELSLGHFSVRNVLEMFRVSTVDFPASVLRNVNRPEDLG